MKNPLTIALALVAMLVVAVVAGPAIAIPTGGYGGQGNRVYASASIADGTGVVTTIAAAGTYVTVGTAAPLVAGANGVGADGSGCITYTLASNKFTIAKACGAGVVRLRACLNNVIGANSAVVLGSWHRVRGGTTTAVGPKMSSKQLGTAAQNPLGCVEHIADATLLDTYDFRYDSNTNADTVTTRAATFTVEKLLNL